MILGLLLALAASGLRSSAEGPVGVALLRLVGPTGGARVEAGGPPTEVWIGLRAGETRTLAVPLELGPLAAPGAPLPERIAVGPLPGADDGGRATLVGWEIEPHAVDAFAGEPGLGPEHRALERLARRSRPPLAPARARATGADLALLGALLCLGLALRHRPRLAVLLGSGGALLVFALPSQRPEPGEIRVLEGDLGAGVWLEVRAGLDRLALEPGEAQAARTRQGSGVLAYRVDARQGVARWWALAPGCELGAARRRVALDLDATRNGLGRIDPLWVRDSSGTWERRPPWEAGQPLPPSAGGPSDGAPPAWLAAALPQGREVWVGKLEPAALADPERTWVRVLGP